MNLEFILNALFTSVAAAVGAYVAIRVKVAQIEAKLDHAHERIGEVNLTATRAHERIDALRFTRTGTD